MKISFILDESIVANSKVIFVKEVDGTIEIDNIEQLAELMLETNVVHSVHKDNKKYNEAFLFTHFIAYDIDGGLSLADAVIKVKNYNHVIATSQSHQKQKGEHPPCDRFRIVIQLKDKITSIDQYHRAYNYFRDNVLKLKLEDNCMQTPHQYMKKHREIISVNSNGLLFDESPFLSENIFIPKAALLDMQMKMQLDESSEAPDEILVRKIIAHIIREAEESIDGKGGDKQTFIVACEICRWNGNFNDLKTYNNLKCKPKWKDKDLKHKWDNAVDNVGKKKFRNYRMKQKIKEIESCK